MPGELPMFTMATPDGTGTDAGKKKSHRVIWGRCPKHNDLHLVHGSKLIRDGDHLFWESHTYTDYAGVKMECIAAGQRLCDLPANPVLGEDVPTCPCQEK